MAKKKQINGQMSRTKVYKNNTTTHRLPDEYAEFIDEMAKLITVRTRSMAINILLGEAIQARKNKA